LSNKKIDKINYSENLLAQIQKTEKDRSNLCFFCITKL